jgi:ATPase family associated with various cellular activities (AAA)
VADQPEGKFILKKKTYFRDLGDTHELPESDLCFQDEEAIYQFKFDKPEVERKEIISPGIFTIESEMHRTVIKKSELRTRNLLTSVVNSKSIIDEANTFFNNLEVYRELEEPLARKILIHSDPGMGKTATITQYCMHAIEDEPGTVVLIWPTSKIDSGDVLDFLSKESEYKPECKRMVLIIEDIGGGEREGSGSTRSVDSSLLDLLDGLQVTFRLPTLIIATTNYPQNLLSALADRPGRFDLIMALKPPTFSERISLTEWIAKRSLTDEEKEAFNMPGTEEFSVAHLKEVVIRSRIHNRTIRTVVKELVEHRKNFQKNFEKDGKGLGFGGRGDD